MAAVEEASAASPSRVIFQCIREGSRLRVRVEPASAAAHRLSPHANTQFPRAIRREGGYYAVNAADVRFRAGPAGKFFYCVKAGDVAILEEGAPEAGASPALPSRLTIYGEGGECCICMTEESAIVLVPCGHYVVCEACATRVSRCPICRSAVEQRVARAQLG